MAAILRFLDRLLSRVNNLALGLGAICIMLIMTVGTLDVISVNTLGIPVPAALEASEVFLGVAIFMTFAHAQAMRQHIHVDLLFNKSSPAVQWVVTLLALVFGAALFCIFGVRALDLAMLSLRIGETANAAFAFPIWPAKLLVAIGAFVAMLEFLRQLVWHFIDPGRLEPKRDQADEGDLV